MDQKLFNHERLEVYREAVNFYAGIDSLSDNWDSKHAIANHLPRAAESVVGNIAEASASYSAQKHGILDYGIGSVLECAACLDIAAIRQLATAETLVDQKELLVSIVNMLVGLRRSWSPRRVGEEPVSYESSGTDQECDRFFRHERLDVYQAAKELAVWFWSFQPLERFSATRFRKVDGLATSIALNIAESNGRFSERDRVRLLGWSHRATIKMAAELDLCEIRGDMDQRAVFDGKKLLARIASMTGAMLGNARGSSTGG